MLEDETGKLAAKIYTFYFTKDGGLLELHPDDPKLVHIRKQCWIHANAFYNLEKEKPSDINIIEKRIPLTNKSYEATLLGALMLDNRAFEIVSVAVKECHFETQRHRNIFKAMIQLKKDKKPLDTLSVYAELERSGQADPNMEIYLFDLAKNTSGAHIEHLPSIANVVWTNAHDRMRRKK